MTAKLKIPEKLVQRVNLWAVSRNQKLKDAIVQLLEIGLRAVSEVERPRVAPKPVRLKGRGPIDIQSIELAIGTGRV
jgi:hypothetical protein